MSYANENTLKKLNLRIGRIKAIKKHPEVANQWVLLIDLGKREQDSQVIIHENDVRDVRALMGKQIVYLLNVKPKTIKGIENQGLVLATYDKKGQTVLLSPNKSVEPGTMTIPLGGG